MSELSELASEERATRNQCNPICPEVLAQLASEGIIYEGKRDGYLLFSYPINSRFHPSRAEYTDYALKVEAIKTIRTLPRFSKNRIDAIKDIAE